MITTQRSAWDVAAEVTDPEIPVISIADLGILRDVREEAGTVVVTITPTYSGCPAMTVIHHDVEQRLHDAGYPDVRVEVVLAPAWTTDWMTERGRAALERFGIAPPAPRRADGSVALSLSVRCPQCGSLDTETLSRFGSTSCKALHRCRACLEPFDSFKTL